MFKFATKNNQQLQQPLYQTENLLEQAVAEERNYLMKRPSLHTRDFSRGLRRLTSP